MLGGYWLYTALIILITISAIYLTTAEAMSNLTHLRNLTGVHGTVLRVCPHSPDSPHSSSLRTTTIDDRKLLPGMHFIITEGMTLPCDAILLSGKVVVDEAMLTGESIPVTKTPLDILDVDTNGIDAVYIATKRSGSVLFGGTKVIACYGEKEKVIAVVYRTAFRSAKGQLIASLLKPKERFMSFVSDAVHVIFAIFCFATLLYFIIVFNLIRLGATSYDIFYHYLEAITIAVPPALTACLTVATSISVNLLKSRR